MRTRQSPSQYLFIVYLPHTQFHHQHELGVWSYTFLDASTPLLVVPRGRGIAFTTRFPSRPSGANSNSNSKLEVKAKAKAKAKTKYLMFPDLAADAAYSSSMGFHDSKLPQPESHPPKSMSFSRATVPAHADHGVVALSISTLEIFHDAPARYLVFFLREVLARLFQQQQEYSLEGEGEGEGPYVVDWADWGLDASRWFAAPSFEQWRGSVHGYRCVTLVTRFEAGMDISPSFVEFPYDICQAERAPKRLHLLVFDFNPYSLRRHQYQPATDNSCPSGNGNGNVVIITPSNYTFPNWGGRFNGDVIGRLACRATLMGEPADYAALVACEDNVIGIQVCPSQYTHIHTST